VVLEDGVMVVAVAPLEETTMDGEDGDDCTTAAAAAAAVLFEVDVLSEM